MLFELMLGASRILPLLPSALIIFSSISQFVYFSCVAHIFWFWLVPQLILLCSQGISFPSLALRKLPAIPDHARPVALASQRCHLTALFALLCCVCWLHSCWAAQWQNNSTAGARRQRTSKPSQYNLLLCCSKKNDAYGKKRKCGFHPPSHL